MKYALLICVLLSSPALADRQSFPPVDEADADASLVAFRANLLQKVAARDVEGVAAAACPDLYLSDEGLGGPDELRASLTADPGNDESAAIVDQFWTDLENTLSQPGYFDDEGEFWMPHQWQITLPATLDPSLAYFVTGEDVALRISGNRGAQIEALVSHEVVLVPTFFGLAEYQRVMLTDGTPGFMHKDFLWPMVGHRAAFVKSGAGEWQLCTFVSGN